MNYISFRIDSTESNAIQNGAEFADLESLDAALREIQQSKTTGGYSKTYVAVLAEGWSVRALIYRARLDIEQRDERNEFVSFTGHLYARRAFYQTDRGRLFLQNCGRDAEDAIAEIETVLDHIFASRGCATPADDFTGARVR